MPSLPVDSYIRRRQNPVSVPIHKPTIPSPEVSFWYWNPNRVGAGRAPEWFEKKLREFDPELEVTWSPYHERWLVWLRSPRLHSKLCSGWSLLFPVKYPDGSYMPLDERIFHRLYHASAHRWGRGKDYFLAVEREWERDREREQKSRDSNVQHAAGEYYDYMQIKNIGSGSKFANHFAG